MVDCSRYSNIPSVIGAVERIIAVGDIHGDFNYLIHLLKVARVIDNNDKWIGGNTYVVQLGDTIDNCRPNFKHCDEKDATPNDKPDDLKILKYLEKLHEEASKKNGAVISLMGNHELMNILGDMSYVSYLNAKEVGGLEKRKKLFQPDGNFGKKLICSHPPAIIIGSNLFVHAGILPDIIKSIPELRKILKQHFDQLLNNMNNDEVISLLVKNIENKKINLQYLIDINPKNSKIWKKIFES